MTFRSIVDTGQNFRKWFCNLLNKIVERVYTVLGHTKFEGLEG